MEFTTLKSGSSGNCIYISGGKTKVLVDAGITMSYMKRALAEIGIKPEEIEAILITHEHNDHIKGAEVLSRRFNIPLYASPLTWHAMPFACKIPEGKKRVFTYDMEIGELKIDFFKLYHDASQPVGMIFYHGDESVAIITDTGQVTSDMIEKLRGVNGLVLEANHSLELLQNGPYPYFLKKRVAGINGHLSNRQAAVFLAKIATEKTKAVIFSHLSQVNNTEEIMKKELKEELSAMNIDLKCQLHIAGRENIHPLIILGHERQGFKL